MSDHSPITFNTSEYSFLTDPDKALEKYHELGYHIEPNVYSAEECAVLIRAAHSLENAQNHVYHPAEMPHQQDVTFDIAMKKPSLLTMLSPFIGGPATAFQSNFFYCKPGSAELSLHQANFYAEAEYGVLISAWIALTDIYREKGGFILYPESHKEGVLPIKKLTASTAQWQNPHEAIVPPRYVACDINIAKGSAIFIHGHLVHGTHPNVTDEWRYLLHNSYVKAGEEVRCKQDVRREEVELV